MDLQILICNEQGQSVQRAPKGHTFARITRFFRVHTETPSSKKLINIASKAALILAASDGNVKQNFRRVSAIFTRHRPAATSLQKCRLPPAFVIKSDYSCSCLDPEVCDD
jgi:hypothetical protein